MKVAINWLPFVSNSSDECDFWWILVSQDAISAAKNSVIVNVLDKGTVLPKLYEYLGLIIFFYSNEHEPVHVHARFQEFESKIEFIITDGQIKKISLKRVPGKKSLPEKQKKQFLNLAETLADEIVQAWISYFIYNKKIVSKKIERLG